METITDRRNWAAVRRFQYTVLLFLMTWTLFIVLVLFLMFRYIVGSMSPFVASAVNGQHLLGVIHSRINLLFGVLIAGVLIMDVLLSMFTLKRVVGPLYRFHNHLLENSREGKLRPVHFRKGDFFSELADAYNQLQHRLNPENDDMAH